jgi:hypothetical protein
LITLAHFRFPRWVSVPKSAREPPNNVPPTNPRLELEIDKAALISVLSLPPISAGAAFRISPPRDDHASFKGLRLI